MDKEKEEELMDYFAQAAFKGERLEAAVRRNIKQEMPYLTVRHQMDYDKEKMFFEFRFRRDHQFDAYRLEGYKATHRKAVEIDHQIINGVDTAKLEARMKEIDWYTHFEKPDKFTGYVKESMIISDLLKLANNHSQEGMKIQELLQFKYFPDRYFDERLKELQSQYDKSREFTATKNGLCIAHLAYHIVSGRLDDLYEKLQYMELAEYLGVEVYTKLETTLETNPKDFELKFFGNGPYGYVEYLISVAKGEGPYSVDTFTVSLTPYPPIEHGVYNDIDIGELETMTRAIDWQDDRELFILREDREPELLPQVAIIQEQMHRLSQNLVGQDLADKLQVKYRTDASFFEGMVQQTAWDYLESLPKRIQQFPVEVKAKTAFNLLCGRAAINNTPFRPSGEGDTWMRLDLSHKDESGNYPIHIIDGFPTSEMEKRLDLIPLYNMHYYPIRNALICGDFLTAQLNNGRKVMLQANPTQKTIDIYTPDMRPIYANLALDPDWRPTIHQNQPRPEKGQKKASVSVKSHFPKPTQKGRRTSKHL